MAITENLINKKIVCEDKIDIYAYGFEIMISYFCYFAIAIIISIVTCTFFESLFFLAGFVLIRKSAGGYHASTYLKCHILFSLNHIVFIVLHNYFLINIYYFMVLFTPLITLISILCFAPIDHENKPFTPNEYLKFKRKSRISSIIVLCVAMIFGFIPQIKSLLFGFLFGVLSAIVSLIVAHIIKKCKTLS